MIFLSQNLFSKFYSFWNFVTQEIFVVFLKENWKDVYDIQQALRGTVVNLCGVID